MAETKRPWSSSRSAVATALVLLLCACALGPLRVDRDARAPSLAGYGRSTMAVGTGSAAARRWFEQGVEQAYAFNEVEAVRSFKAALAQDPSCAMCAWGVAWQLGPTINDTGRGDLGEALRYVGYAMGRRETLAARDRGLIEALALRYGHVSEAKTVAVLAAPVCGTGAGGEKADPLDVAYAERMRLLADQFPDDADVLSLYAEAEMIATRADYWWDPKTAQPVGRIGELTGRLEASLKQHAEHIGLLHYLIHAVDAQNVAARAEAAADRLGGLAPSSPHLLHMPAHTYLQLGRYADASRVNVQALAADEALAADLGKQGFSVSKDWRGHDGVFLWYAALMEGRGDLALSTARASAARAAKVDNEFGELARSRPLLTLLRMERWDEVLREPVPGGSKGLATLIDQYARGVALSRTGQGPGAAETLARLEPAVAAITGAHAGDGYVDKLLRGIALVAQEQLRAEVALGAGREDAALASLAQAVALSKDIDETEPPMTAAGARLALGDMQLQTRRWTDAEQTFRADLVEHPKSGWAMRGLIRSLRAQGRQPEADALRAELVRGWSAADARLLALN